MAQAGGAGLLLCQAISKNALFFLASVDKVKFRRQVLPGETVRMEITHLRVSSRMIKQSGKAFVQDELACEAEWMCLVSASANNHVGAQ
jgi:3-hydroxyacyl-[acyl-carrier-protein] dehydratase